MYETSCAVRNESVWPFVFFFLIYKDIPLFLGLYLNVSGFDIETAKAWFPLLRLFVTCGNFVHLPYLSSS